MIRNETYLVSMRILSHGSIKLGEQMATVNTLVSELSAPLPADRVIDPPTALSDKRKRRSPDSGVTLIEMMVVLVIIGIVAALVVPNVIGRPDEARVAVAGADLRAVAASLEMYRLDNRVYPTTEQGLSALTQRPTSQPVPVNWIEGGYLPTPPVDPWGNPYIYRSPAEDGPYDLISNGADGVPGGEGSDADIRHGPQTNAANE